MNNEPRKVKVCFGRYGETDCLGIINCSDYKKCSQCYFKYFSSAKKKFGIPHKIPKKEVEKFCELNNLEIKQIKESRDGKETRE